jgi:DNA-binding beta-propeller fold protein YncE/mono/diheme cytochrome c family protein
MNRTMHRHARRRTGDSAARRTAAVFAVDRSSLVLDDGAVNAAVNKGLAMKGWMWLGLALATGCGDSSSGTAPTATSSASIRPAASAVPTKVEPPARTRLGSTVAVSEDGATVLVAEEDRGVLWHVATPVTAESTPKRIDLPGPPAQVLPLRDSTLVTIRDPGLLLVLDSGLREVGRVPLAADAWGVAVTADSKIAVVSSAWTHRLTGVDLGTREVRWTVDVAREPRAVVIPKSGDRAYVTHLVGTALTRVDGLGGTAPKVRRVELPAAASRNPDPKLVSASLGYSATLSPDESRLFVPRHALGALGDWWGAATVDVLGLKGDRALAPSREPVYQATRLSDFIEESGDVMYAPTRDTDGAYGHIPKVDASPFVQPRAVVHRRATNTLLVASEGSDEIVELDARMLEPALLPRKRYRIGGDYPKAIVNARHGGAPSGIALSIDESKAYVFCRTTADLAVVPLVPLDEHTDPLDTTILRLGEDPLLADVAKADPKRKFMEAAAIGRKLFYNAIDSNVSGGMGCAGCHPDGRDDGHVWHEVTATGPFADKPFSIFVGGAALVKHHHATIQTSQLDTSDRTGERGRARQTPMLAGRMRGDGGFGWQAESDSLVARVEAGFRLHRWGSKWEPDVGAGGHAGAIASFLLSSGMRPPPRPTSLNPEQKRGEAIFKDDAVGCAACHLPEDKFSNWVAVKVKSPAPRAGFEDESNEPFKTPSLHFVGGTAPYFHDGSVATLAELVANNGSRMGKTAHLSPADQKALVAYMEAL